VAALEKAGKQAEGATMYVTLEPCAHHGRTLPCVKAIRKAGISKVVVALRDPNPDVKGGGWEQLEAAGISVEQGAYEDVARRQNEAFIKRVTTGLPFLTLKMAMSVDGRVATNTGSSRWISGEDSRSEVHEMRAASDAVMVGIGTVLMDDPQLTARTGRTDQKQPLRVVVDWDARTPVGSRLADVSLAPTLVAASDRAPQRAVDALQSRGVEVGGRVDLRALMEELASRDMNAVQCEGGPGLAAMLLREKLVDRIVLFIAPCIISGRDAPGPIGGEGIEEMIDAMSVRFDSVGVSGEDIRIVACPVYDQESDKCSQE
jgi:diaminohydroxyphosphoribosylaminopyrimidine deaminase/5-amino-6-(5-phosphoribosylamino)uracil reductase